MARFFPDFLSLSLGSGRRISHTFRQCFLLFAGIPLDQTSPAKMSLTGSTSESATVFGSSMPARTRNAYISCKGTNAESLPTVRVGVGDSLCQSSRFSYFFDAISSNQLSIASLLECKPPNASLSRGSQSLDGCDVALRADTPATNLTTDCISTDSVQRFPLISHHCNEA